MKKILLLTLIVLYGCGVPKSDYDKLESKNDSLSERISELNSTIKSLRDSVSILSYPAEHRFNHIIELVKEEKYDEAKNSILELKNVFPHSAESKKCDEQSDIIDKKMAEQKAKEERMKALGFKVFNDNTVVNTNDTKCRYSGFNYGRTYTFDYCGDVGEYSYRTADKDNTYILVSLNMSTKEKYASTPSMKVYKIENGKLKEIGYFSTEYATWTSYGAKIGNYSDDSHDFSKVNSINYKMAAEISIEDSKKPLVILISKSQDSLGDNLTVEDVNNNYIVIRILNRNRL